ncbi:MAG TPA: hypothetical protein VM290_01955 [Gaiellaceae bacterium]|nr:hypothetical protein [Gaiellaceae bacterium]
MGEREERIAENEARFREANEGLVEEWQDMDVPPSERTMFICECGNADCREIIRLTLDEYRAVRRDPYAFAVVPGHDDTETERVVTEDVVDRNERFAVVKKRSEYRAAIEGGDSR